MNRLHFPDPDGRILHDPVKRGFVPFLCAVLLIFLFSAACASPARSTDSRPPGNGRIPTATTAPRAAAPDPTATTAPRAADPDPTATTAPIAVDPNQTATNISIAVDANATIPAGASVNLLPNGKLQDANGNPSFAGWEQSPAYWCDWSINPASCGLHRPLPPSPSQTWSLQADRDYLRMDIWPSGCCPEARAWTDAVNLSPHNQLFFGWEELHHLGAGVLEIRVFGIDKNGGLVEIFLQDGTSSASINSKQDPPGVFLVEIPIPEGGYPGYRVEVYVKLVGEFDGILIGDFKLMTLP